MSPLQFAPIAIPRQLALAVLIGLIHQPAIAPAAGADSIVTVTLLDGRQFAAAVDARTSDERLWLRFDRPAALILRPIEWSAIGAIEQGERRMTVAEFKPTLADVATERRLQRPRLQRASDNAPQPEELAPPPVASLDVEASLANWDADPEPDGLEVQLLPRDAFGRLTPTAGTIDASLVGVTGIRRASPSGRARAIDDRFPVLGRWGVTIRPEDFDAYGATIRLPFQGVDPNEAEWIRNLGAVHVRLGVAGVGVFAATDDAVLLRSLSPLRSRHEAFYRTRMLPNE